MSDDKTKEITLPYVADWSALKKRFLIQKLHQAASVRKSAVGATDVLHAAKQKKGQLLIVERNYTYPVINNYIREIDGIKNISTGALFTDLVEEIH